MVDIEQLTKRQRRKSYTFEFKMSAQLDILTKEEKDGVPKSTLSTFRSSDYSNVKGIEKVDPLRSARIDFARKIIKSDRLVKIFNAYSKIKNTLIIIFSSLKNIKPHLKKFKEKVVTTISRVKDVIGLDRACHYFRISVSRFYSWLHQVKHSCPTSAFKMCRRQWPNQLSPNELSVMKKTIENPFFKGWAIYQIAVYYLIHNILAASVGTWYKYINALGINTFRLRKKKQKIGIRAAKPNEIWHMDTTIFRMLDNSKACIHILIDNCSRFIVGWCVSLVLSGKTCLEMIRKAYYKYLAHRADNSDVTVLITDGGPENCNGDVDAFIEQPCIPIIKLLAQKDIHFSNSMVEAFNKTLKYRHLFPYEIMDFESLEKHLEKAIPEYNNVRPHCAHKLLTPSQVYFGQDIDREELRKRLLEAGKKRILDNRNAECSAC